MAKQNDDDLADLLGELAKAQQNQEDELHELVGSVRTPASASSDKAASSSAAAIGSGTVEVTGEIDEDGVATRGPADAPVIEPEEPVITENEGGVAEDDDPLAKLAMEAGDAATANPSAEPSPATIESEAMHAPIDLTEQAPLPRRSGSGAMRSAASSRTASASRSSRPVKPAKPAPTMQAVFAPVLITFGLITLIPAVWAVLVLMGVEVPLHDGQGVDGMAKLMLVCWPVGLGLLAGGIVSVVQVARQNKKQREKQAGRR